MNYAPFEPMHMITVNHIFDEKEWRCIEVFKRRAKEFIAIRAGMKVGIIRVSMQRHPDGKYSGKASTPNEDSLLPLYLAFRHFYLEKEPEYFPKVANIISNCSHDEKLVLYLRKIKAQWKGTLSDDSWLKYKGNPVAAKTVMKLWFNAHFFHSDIEKEIELEELNSVLSTEISQHCLFMAVHDAGLAIGNLNKSIAALEQNGGSITFPLRLVDKRPTME